MQSRTLVLTPWYLPYRVVSWQDAVTMMYLAKVDVVASYNEELRSPSTTIAKPAVVRMRRHGRQNRYRVRFSRRNVLMRDDFTCMYCGRDLPLRELTLDHVLPKAQGGTTNWHNILSACQRCNAKKGSRTPAEAGMPPLRQPYKPASLPVRPKQVALGNVPFEWHDFCR